MTVLWLTQSQEIWRRDFGVDEFDVPTQSLDLSLTKKKKLLGRFIVKTKN